MNKAYLLTGGNMGDRLSYLEKASEAIENSAGKIIMRSSLYETEAWGIGDQPLFINQVILIDTLLSPQDLLTCLLCIEEKLGRKRVIKFGPRLIDIDILLFNNDVINEPGLTIPHPELQNRLFALVPLNEIAPNLHHPVLKKTVAQLLADCKDELQVRKVDSD